MISKSILGISITIVALGLILPLGISSNQADAIVPGQIGLDTSNTFFLGGDITSPNNDKPFGGEAVGDYFMRINENSIRILVEFENPASDGTVYEGWLVDVNSGYKLSLGQLNQASNMLFFAQDIVNPWIYDVLVITAEPIGDTDPSPTLPPVGGVPLSNPFGQ
jgi:hypothetical protein